MLLFLWCNKMNYFNKIVNAKRLFDANQLKIKKSYNKMQISSYVGKEKWFTIWGRKLVLTLSSYIYP